MIGMRSNLTYVRYMPVSRFSRAKLALSRVATAGIIVVVIIIIAAAGLIATTSHSSATTTTTSSLTTTPSVSTSVSSSSQSVSVPSTSSSTSSANSTLVIDDVSWPVNDFNMLYLTESLPYPQWGFDSVYQTLVDINETAFFDSGISEYLPGLAQSWSVSPNGSVYTFNLRNGATFSNGDPFNAYQVWTDLYLEYYLSGNSSDWWISYTLFNMSYVNFGPATISLLNQSGLASPNAAALAIMQNSSWPIYVTGPNQIVFRLAYPITFFLGTIVIEVGNIFDAQYVLDNGGPGTDVAINSHFNTNPIPGTGPYMFTQISEQSYARFSRNPTYWGNNLTTSEIQANPFLQPGHVQNIIVYAKSSDLARFTDLSSGAAQIAIIESEDWSSVVSNPAAYSYYKDTNHSTLFMPFSLDTQLYPTNITDVRLAIVHAINYTDMIDTAWLGEGQELVPPEYPAYGQYYNLPGLQPYQFNLTLAKQYLSEANITNMPSLTFYGPSNVHNIALAAQVIQSDLAQIGINLVITTLPQTQCTAEQGSFSYNLGNYTYNISLPGCNDWGPDALTPLDAFLDFLSNNSLYGNTAVYSNPAVENAINAFYSSNNVTYIQSFVSQAETQVYNDAPYFMIGLGLWEGDGSIVWRNGVVNSFLVDPMSTGCDTIPILNTITLG